MTTAQPKRVVFRTDASNTLGVGHVMRCLALAEKLKDRGAEIHFVCREFDGHLAERIARQYGHHIHRLPRPESPLPKSGSAAWLGLDWSIDAEETRAALSSLKGPIHWLVVDHYGIDTKWETEIRPHAQRLMVIDDLIDRPHECDLLLNHNLVPDAAASYDSLVPAHCRLLIGPKYALLRSEFTTCKRAASVRKATNRLLVFFGGADPTNETSKAIKAISMLGVSQVQQVDVLVGSANPNREQIIRLCSASPIFHVHDHQQEVGDLFLRADLALGAGGGTTWERSCVGLPSLIVTIAENQEGPARAAHNAGIIRCIGRSQDVDVIMLADELRRMLADTSLLRVMSQRGFELVDGLGTERISKAMGFSEYRISFIAPPDRNMDKQLSEVTAHLSRQGHHVSWPSSPDDGPIGDFAFILLDAQEATPSVLARHRESLVALCENADLEAGLVSISLRPITESRLSDRVYLRDTIPLSGTWRASSHHDLLSAAALKLCREFVEHYPDILSRGSHPFTTAKAANWPSSEGLDLSQSKVGETR